MAKNLIVMNMHGTSMGRWGVPVAGLLALAPRVAAAAEERVGGSCRPNIIVIMADQQRFDAMGCAGNSCILTPHIDRLAGEGHRFCNAYTSAPSSTPARAGMLTGMSPWHHGMLGYGVVAGQYKYEGPRMLSAAGYLTMAIGKNHWHPQTHTHGYEVVLTDESGRVEGQFFMSDYRKWFNTQALGLNPDSTGVGWNAHLGRAYRLPERLHPTRWTGDRAVEAIEGFCSAAPLFLKVSFARPHSPYDPPQRVLDKYAGVEMPAPWVGDWVSDMPIDVHPERRPDAARGNFGDAYAENSRRHYYASVTFVDEQVGRIVEALKRKGIYDNTLICYVADHGDMLGDHHMWRKTYAYEGSAAIPFIVKLPKRMEEACRAGAVMEQPVELRDLLPTFLELGGEQVPADMDGRSLLPLFKGNGAPWREFIDMEHSATYWQDNYWCALANGDVKYIWFFRSGREQLFDLRKDPHELCDLSGAKDKRTRRVLEKMRKAMAAHLEERGEGWVKQGKLQVRKASMLYSPNYPGTGK